MCILAWPVVRERNASNARSAAFKPQDYFKEHTVSIRSMSRRCIRNVVGHVNHNALSNTRSDSLTQRKTCDQKRYRF